MKRITRSSSKSVTDDVPSYLEEENQNSNIKKGNSSKSQELSETDLSQFQLKSKQKLKRKHITIECETNIESNAQKSKITGPKNWITVLENLRKMRENQDAPVDTMGCDQCPDEDASPKVLYNYI